jgi:osmotically-inducible protein OsmY
MVAPASRKILPLDPAARADALFRHSGYPFLNLLKCTFRSGILVLAGTVPPYHLREMAEGLARQVDGVDAVLDRVEVVQRTSAARKAACY